MEHPTLDRPFETWNASPDEFRRNLLQSGVVLLRSAVPPDLIRTLGETVERMLAHYRAIPAEVIERETAHESPEVQSAWRERRRGRHYNLDLIAFSQGRLSLFDVIRSSGLQALAEAAFAPCQVWDNPISNVRHVVPGRAGDAYGSLPIHMHIDAYVHQHNALGINFWTPLSEVGADRPGLSVIPLSIVETRRYLDYNPQGHLQSAASSGAASCIREDRMTQAALVEAGLADRTWTPVMQPGDVLAFSNFTLHSSYVPPGSTLARTSLEIRVLLRPEGVTDDDGSGWLDHVLS